MSRRFREQGDRGRARRPVRPADPTPVGAGAELVATLMDDVVAVVLFVGVTAYALFGGADFGAGFWDLVAGGAERGARAARRSSTTRSGRCGRRTTSG